MVDPPSSVGALQTTVSEVRSPVTDVIVGAPGLSWARLVAAISEMQHATRVATMVRALTVSPLVRSQLGPGEFHALLRSKQTGEVERGKSGLGLNEEPVRGEAVALHTAQGHPVVGEELVDPDLVPVGVENDQNASGQRHQLTGAGAEDRGFVALRACVLALDEVPAAIGLSYDAQIGDVGDRPGVLAVLPGVTRALDRRIIDRLI